MTWRERLAANYGKPAGTWWMVVTYNRERTAVVFVDALDADTALVLGVERLDVAGLTFAVRTD